MSLYLDRLDEIHQEGTGAVQELVGTRLVRYPSPTVLPYILKRAGRPDRILEVAYELRDGRGARALRERSSDFERAISVGDFRAGLKLRQDLDDLTARLREELGLTRSPQVATTFSIGALGLSASFPGLPIPRAVVRRMRVGVESIRRPWMVLLQDVFDALSSAASLGPLHEMLAPPTRGDA